MIFFKIARRPKSKQVITSGVGTREGVFLKDLLRASHTFPINFNPSLKSLQDRFLKQDLDYKALHFASQPFDALQDPHYLNRRYRNILINAAKLSHIGEYLNPYFANEHVMNFILGGLNCGFSHQDKVLIATIIKLNGKKSNPYTNEPLRQLLPNIKTIIWLSFLLALAKALNYEDKVPLELLGSTLHIYNEDKELDLAKEELKKIPKFVSLTLVIN